MVSPATPGTPCAVQDIPFDKALREAHGHLFAAHCAALGTLESELSRIRHENTILRMKLVEAQACKPSDAKAAVSPSSTNSMGCQSSITTAGPELAKEFAQAGQAPEKMSLHAHPSASAAASSTATGIAHIISLDTLDMDVLDVSAEAIRQQVEPPMAAANTPSTACHSITRAPVEPKDDSGWAVSAVAVATQHEASEPSDQEASDAVISQVPEEGTAHSFSAFTVSATSSKGPPVRSITKGGVTSIVSLQAPTMAPAPASTSGPTSTLAHAPAQQAVSPLPALGPQVAATSRPVAPAMSSIPSSSRISLAAAMSGPSSSGQAIAASAAKSVVATSTPGPQSQAICLEVLTDGKHQSEGFPSQPSSPSKDFQANTLPHKEELEDVVEIALALHEHYGKDEAFATTKEKPPKTELTDVIEVVTPGACALLANANPLALGDMALADQQDKELFPVAVTQDMDRALEAVLAFHGWQHVDVQHVAEGMYSVGGSEFQVRCESFVTAEEAASECPYHLSASSDGGQTWEAVASLVRSRRLHKVVRTDPIVSELSLDELQEEAQQVPSENLASEAPISLADLARMPYRMSGSSQGASRQQPGGYDGDWNPPPDSHDSPGVGGSYSGYSSSSYPGSPRHSSSTSGMRPLVSPHTGVAPLPLGPDGLPSHRHDGLPTFNAAFPTYFSALSGPTHYYNQFRVPDRQSS